MPLTITYPGVYVEELNELSLSVATGATAVPVIAAAQSSADEKDLITPVRVNSWLDFTSKLGRKPDGKTNVDYGKKLHASVRAYFENGGGPCYLLAADKFLEEVPKLDDVTLLVAAGRDIKSAVDTLCVDGSGLFAVLDTQDVDVKGLTAEQQSLSPTAHAAAYYPWLEADWAKSSGENPEVTAVPPSAAVAGVYCSVDRTRGVWKAPANTVLKAGLRPKYKVSDIDQGQFNTGLAINMIREFSGVNTVWGARTLDDSDNWRYIPVRRLFDAAQRDIKKAMEPAVFEPNNQVTWEKVRSAVDAYLHKLWRAGGLLGGRPEDAYFVQIGKGITMTDDDIQQGKMIVKIGLSAVRPAEFIILQFSQEVGQG